MKKVLFLLLGYAALAAHGSERIYEKEFPVGPGASFSLDSHKGIIHIRTDNVSTIRARARIYPEESTDPALLQHVRIRERTGGNQVSLEVEFDDRSARIDGLLGESVSWPAVEWEITLPDDASLALETHKSEVDLDVPAGSVEIESHKGHGSIRGVRGRLALETHKGDFDVEVLELADVGVETHKGNISLTLPWTQNFTLRAESHDGSFRFLGLDIPVKREDDEITAYYKAGDGSNRIELQTHKGSISVAFAN